MVSELGSGESERLILGLGLKQKWCQKWDEYLQEILGL